MLNVTILFGIYLNISLYIILMLNVNTLKFR